MPKINNDIPRVYMSKLFPEEILDNATRMVQPSVDPSTLCTILLVVEEQDPNWIKIPCDKPLLDIITCKKPLKSKPDKSVTPLLKNKLSCPPSWIGLNKQCYK